jgi:hypothetical protein
MTLVITLILTPKMDLGSPWTAFGLPEYKFPSGTEIFLNPLRRDIIQPNPVYVIPAKMEAYEPSSEAKDIRLRRLESQYDTIRYFIDPTPDNKKEHAKWVIGGDNVFRRYEDIHMAGRGEITKHVFLLRSRSPHRR